MELHIGTQYARFWRRHSNENLDEMYTRRLDSLHSARQQQNEIRKLLEFTERIGVYSSNSGTLVVQQFNRN